MKSLTDTSLIAGNGTEPFSTLTVHNDILHFHYKKFDKVKER